MTELISEARHSRTGRYFILAFFAALLILYISLTIRQMRGTVSHLLMHSVPTAMHRKYPQFLNELMFPPVSSLSGTDKSHFQFVYETYDSEIIRLPDGETYKFRYSRKPEVSLWNSLVNPREVESRAIRVPSPSEDNSPTSVSLSET